MPKRKRKNAVTLILLLFALAGLTGFYIWYTNREPVTEEDKEETELALSTIISEDIVSLHYKYQDTDLTLQREGERWVSEADINRPINQDRVNSILGVIDDIRALRIIAEKPERLEDYGLAAPTTYLQATRRDGSKVTLQLGEKAATGNGYYALVNEDDRVYLLANSYGSGLSFTNSDMTAVAENLTIEAGNIRRIAVDNRDSEDFELLYQENHGLDNSGSSMFPWLIVKPFTKGYTADSSAVSALMENYVTFDFIKAVEYAPAELGKYDLADPSSAIRLEYLVTRKEKLETPEKNPDTGEELSEKTYYEPKELVLYVGSLDEDNNYYVKLNGDNAVYTMDKDTIDKMVEVDTFHLLNKFIAIPNIDMVDRIDMSIDGIAYTMSMERSKDRNEKGEELKTAYFYNQSEAEEDVFKKVYQKIISASYDAPIMEEINTDGISPKLTIAFYLNDEKRTVLKTSYLPYNDSFYIINNEEISFFADKRKIDDIIKTVIEWKPVD